MQKSKPRVETPKLQGEGTFVRVSVMTWGEKKAFRKAQRSQLERAMKLARQHGTGAGLSAVAGQFDTEPVEQELINRVLDWNWTDAEDQPLPLPRNDPSVLDRLTEDELLFLTRLMIGEIQSEDDPDAEAAQKN